MLGRFLEWVTDRLPGRFILGFKGEPYLERYHVLGIKWFEVVLHRFVASDPDRGLHDHPWNWSVSFVLVGEYIEVIFTDHRYESRLIRWVNFISGCRFHRVVKPVHVEEPIWTLFIHGRRKKGWGFMLPDLIKQNGEVERAVFKKYEGPYGGDLWWKHAQKGRELKQLREEIEK